MLKGQSIIGKKVLSRMDGQRIDSVRDIVISKDHSRIVALILEEGGLFSAATAVGFENVVSFGKDAVVITDSKKVVRVDHFAAVKEIMDDRDSLVGKQVFTETGDQLGKVDDVYFDESTGNITALDVTGKFVPNGRNTNAQLPLSDVVSIGPDAVMIGTSAVAGLAAQAGGGSSHVDTPVPTPTPTPTPTPAPMPIESSDAGTSAQSYMPDLTGAGGSSSGGFESGAGASSTLSAPPTSALAEDNPTTMMGSDSDDDLPGSMARVSDPTSGDRG